VWPTARPIETPRLTLEPLRVEHADEIVSVLDSESLYDFIEGQAESLHELRETYRRRAKGHSPDGSQGWLNWIVRERSTGFAVGTVQATLPEGAMRAEVAWIIGSRHQGLGYAKEAAAAMVDWLREQRVRDFVAHIAPGHTASDAVARHLGLTPTDRLIDGEVVWVS
jgi:RimJ/RimL family protein N-acetyltransferase